MLKHDRAYLSVDTKENMRVLMKCNKVYLFQGIAY